MAEHDRGDPRLLPACVVRGARQHRAARRHNRDPHDLVAARRVLQRLPRRCAPARRRVGRRPIALLRGPGQQSAVGVLHRHRRAESPRECSYEAREPHLVEHQLHQLPMSLFGPLHLGPSAAQLVVGAGELPDHLLLTGAQPRGLQRQRSLPGEQLDQLDLRRREVAGGDRVPDEHARRRRRTTVVLRCRERHRHQTSVALRRGEVGQPAVVRGHPDVRHGHRAAFPEGPSRGGVERRPRRVHEERAAVAEQGDVVRGQAAPSLDVQVLPGGVGQHHGAELEADQVARPLRDPGEHRVEGLGGVHGTGDLADGGHPGPQRCRHPGRHHPCTVAGRSRGGKTRPAPSGDLASRRSRRGGAARRRGTGPRAPSPRGTARRRPAPACAPAALGRAQAAPVPTRAGRPRRRPRTW